MLYTYPVDKFYPLICVNMAGLVSSYLFWTWPLSSLKLTDHSAVFVNKRCFMNSLCTDLGC